MKDVIQKVQKGIGTLPKDRDGYGYKYTDLDTVVTKLSPLLGDSVISFQLDGSDIHLCLDEKSVSKLDLTTMLGGTMSPAQQMGAAITYARRYLLVSYFNLLADEDVDGAVQRGPVGREDDNKPWLQENSEEFSRVVNAIQSGTAVASDARKKYKVSKAVFAKLESVAKE